MRPARPAPRRWAPAFPFDPRSAPFFYGWVIVFSATIGVICSIPGQTMGISVFTDLLMADLGLSRVQLSTAYCTGTVLSGLTLPYLGGLFDRFGARRMIVYAALATGIVLFYLSRSADLAASIRSALGTDSIVPSFAAILLGFYLVRASAQGVLTMTSRNAMGKWFNRRRGIALAVSGVATSFAFSSAPRGLDAIIGAQGWEKAWQILGIALFLMAALGWLLLRDNPEECGLAMDGGAGSAPKRLNPDMHLAREYTRREAVRTLPFWVFNLSFSFFSLFTTAITFHIISLSEEIGVDRARILGLFIPMAAVSVATNLFCGWASAHTRLKYLLVFLNGGAIAGALGLLHIHSAAGLAAYVGGIGAAGGAFSCLSGIVWPRFFGRLHLGAISGVGMSSMVIASGIGPLVFAISQDVTGSYAQTLWLSAGVAAALLVLGWWSDNPQRREAPAI